MKNLKSVTASLVVCVVLSVECQAGNFFENVQETNASLQHQSAQPQRVRQKVPQSLSEIIAEPEKFEEYLSKMNADYLIPEFSSLQEGKKWKINNQIEINKECDELNKKARTIGMNYFVTINDSLESIEKKYNNYESLYNEIEDDIHYLSMQYHILNKRCSIQECTVNFEIKQMCENSKKTNAPIGIVYSSTDYGNVSTYVKDETFACATDNLRLIAKRDAKSYKESLQNIYERYEKIQSDYKKSKKNQAKTDADNEKFRKNLKIGDETFFGRVTEIQGDKIKIKRIRCIYIDSVCVREQIIEDWWNRKNIFKNPFADFAKKF